jgi:hypothetical protein
MQYVSRESKCKREQVLENSSRRDVVETEAMSAVEERMALTNSRKQFRPGRAACPPL